MKEKLVISILPHEDGIKMVTRSEGIDPIELAEVAVNMLPRLIKKIAWKLSDDVDDEEIYHDMIEDVIKELEDTDLWPIIDVLWKTH